jgi:type II secretory pathway pseudopilin PulG
MHKKQTKSAFTLAETLIAIGIIGVVSALTIPTLIKNYQKRVIEVNLKKTYADISRVIRQSEAENGTFDGWDYTIGYDAVLKKYIMPYIQLYPCNGRCFDPKIGNGGNWHSGKTNQAPGGIYNVPPKYYTKDGRHIAFVYWGHEPYNGYKTLVFIVDVNGNAGKSVMGQDVFAISPKRWGTNESISMALHDYNKTNTFSDAEVQRRCFAKADEGAQCGEWIKRNGWKFPKNYPYEVGVKSE